MSRPPDRRRGPAEVTIPQQGPSVEPPPSSTDKPTIAGGSETCPRCGVPYAETDEDVLARCAALAREAP